MLIEALFLSCGSGDALVCNAGLQAFSTACGNDAIIDWYVHVNIVFLHSVTT